MQCIRTLSPSISTEHFCECRLSPRMFLWILQIYGENTYVPMDFATFVLSNSGGSITITIQVLHCSHWITIVAAANSNRSKCNAFLRFQPFFASASSVEIWINFDRNASNWWPTSIMDWNTAAKPTAQRKPMKHLVRAIHNLKCSTVIRIWALSLLPIWASACIQLVY